MLDKYVQKTKEIAAREILDELFVLTLDDGVLHRINTMGQKTWDMVDGNTTVSEIIERITSKYDIDRETATKDIVEFFQSLLDKGIIFLRDDSQKISVISANKNRGDK